VDLPAFLSQRHPIAEQLRSLLGLPESSNLRGDDVITLIQGLDEASRALANECIARLREMDDEAIRLGLITPLEGSGAYGYDLTGPRPGIQA
jgi:hypothetical protein